MLYPYLPGKWLCYPVVYGKHLSPEQSSDYRKLPFNRAYLKSFYAQIPIILIPGNIRIKGLTFGVGYGILRADKKLLII